MSQLPVMIIDYRQTFALHFTQNPKISNLWAHISRTKSHNSRKHLPNHYLRCWHTPSYAGQFDRITQRGCNCCRSQVDGWGLEHR